MPQFVIDAQIEAVNKGGGVFSELGFSSSAPRIKLELDFHKGNTVTIFVGAAGGKSIGAISALPGEQEVLFPPSQVQWLYYRPQSVKGKITNLFLANIMTTGANLK